MLEEIGIALASYYDTVTGAKSMLESATNQIKENYIGALYAEKNKEAQDIYNTTVQESRETNYNACLAVLDDVSNKAQNVVEQHVDPDFLATLEIVKTLKDKTPSEINGIIGAHKNNYWAYRAICDVLGGSVKGFIAPTIDDIQDVISYVRSNIHDCFYSDNVDAYHFQNWWNGTLLPEADKKISAFIECRFEDVNAPDLETDSSES